MCVQYRLDPDCASLAEVYSLDDFPALMWKPRIFPRYSAAVVLQKDSIRSLQLFHFGLIPSFEHEAKPKKVFHNARSETLLEKPSFRLPFQRYRCLVPMSSFFEYLPLDGKKVLHEFQPKKGNLLTAAGIYWAWKSPTGEVLDTFSIVTKEAPEYIRHFGHDRSPVFLDKAGLTTWLSIDEPLPSLQQLLRNSNVPDFSITRPAEH